MSISRHALLVVLFIGFSWFPALADENDVPGARDHKMFTRMPGFFIDAFEQKEAASYTVDADQDKTGVTDRRVLIDYVLREASPPPHDGQIIGNHAAAVSALGGHVIFRDENAAVFRIQEEFTEIWVHLVVWGGDRYGLRIIETHVAPPKTVMDPHLLAESLEAEGRVAIYGLVFDAEKTVVTPESTPILVAISDLLKAYPDLRLHVVGHTDNQGNFLGSLNRSKREANLVVRELLANYGIKPGRLQPYGVGPLSPIASNGHEPGRRLNRRLDLVLR